MTAPTEANMTTLREAAKQALEALEHIQRCIGFATATIHRGSATWCQSEDAIASIKAALAQQAATENCPQPEICGSKECEFCRDTAAPAPQAQDKSDNYLSGYCTGRTDLLKEQSAQPAQYVKAA